MWWTGQKNYWEGVGRNSTILVHVWTNDRIHGGWEILKKQLGKLGRTTNVISSGILSVPYETQEREQEIRELNAWLKTCHRKKEFGFLEHQTF